MRRSLIILPVILCALTSDARAQSSGISVRQLSWIAGCWRQSSRGNRVIDEQWMEPRGGLMLGMSRTVRADSLLEFEQLRIVARDGRLVYHAEPSGHEPADFEARSASDSLVSFENPAHDFPQRIIYRRRGADSLLARIEGTRNGQTRGIDFPYNRVPCP